MPHPAYTTTWDDAQAIPTTTDGSQTFVYENADSVSAKAAYAQQIGGITLWDLAAEGRPGLPDAPLTTAIITTLATVE